MARILVVDNANSEEVATVVRDAPVPVERLVPGRNLGCGGGVAYGLRAVLTDPEITHVCIFDDDSYATPGALSALLAALGAADADAAVPLLADSWGKLGWFPGPLAQPAWDVIRRLGVTPGQFRAQCGDTPLAWNWAPWTVLLVTRRAIEAIGLPRDDFWFQGEDLEWTLRLTARFRGVLAPASLCLHVPPPARDKAAARQRDWLKQCSMLQNSAYIVTRLPHGRRALRHLPGNVWRFVSRAGFVAGAWRDATTALWMGAVRGLPAGAPGGNSWAQRWASAQLS
jgi:GT2 family glycosyltransferase